MKIVVAVDKFRGSFTAAQAAESISRGLRRIRPDARIECVALADGGEGTLDILVAAHHGRRRTMPAAGPLGEDRSGEVGLIDGAATAIIELAQIAGLSLVPPAQRNALHTTTYGVGQLLRGALDSGVERIILTLGGSATVDGGIGLMQALGLKLFDRSGHALADKAAGRDLSGIARISAESLHPALGEIRILAAVDVLNPLCGKIGAAQVFARQKGADDPGVAELERGLANWANLLAEICGRDISGDPGTGAAGGAAAPLVALCDAQIVPGIDLVIDATNLARIISDADLVITGEGCLDRQSIMGKTVGGVARLARGANIRCVAIAGDFGPGYEACEEWLDDCIRLIDLAGSAESAITSADHWLQVAAERLLQPG